MGRYVCGLKSIFIDFLIFYYRSVLFLIVVFRSHSFIFFGLVCLLLLFTLSPFIFSLSVSFFFFTEVHPGTNNMYICTDNMYITPYLPICSIHISMYTDYSYYCLFVYSSVYRFIYLSNYIFIFYPSIYLSNYISIFYPSTYL